MIYFKTICIFLNSAIYFKNIFQNKDEGHENSFYESMHTAFIGIFLTLCIALSMKV